MKKMIELQPITTVLSDYEDLKLEIMQLFRKLIYIPLIKEFGPSTTLKNNKDYLIEAIQSGRLQYSRGHFTGKLNSTLAKELRRIGAEWQKGTGSFFLPQSKMSMEIIQALSTAQSRFDKTLEKINSKLSSFVPSEIAEKLDVSHLFEKTIWKTNKSVNDTVDKITVTPQLSKENVQRIAKEYTDNMQLYIKDWVESEIVELRKNIGERSMQGIRYDDLIGEIQKSYDVSRKKAKFLARQETSLLMTKFKQVRYQEAGVNEYKWVCRKHPHQHKGAPYLKGEVRYYHAILDQKIFRWDSPPVVNENGDRKNPGQDYGCFCTAVPIVRLD